MVNAREHVPLSVRPGPLSAAGNNYRANIGLGPLATTSAEYRDSGNGLFVEFLTAIRPASVTDGLSHTVAFSERLRGSGRGDYPAPSATTGRCRSAGSTPPTSCSWAAGPRLCPGPPSPTPTAGTPGSGSVGSGRPLHTRNNRMAAFLIAFSERGFHRHGNGQQHAPRRCQRPHGGWISSIRHGNDLFARLAWGTRNGGEFVD